MTPEEPPKVTKGWTTRNGKREPADFDEWLAGVAYALTEAVVEMDLAHDAEYQALGGDPS